MRKATKWTVTIGLLTGIFVAARSKSVKNSMVHAKVSVTETKQLINRLSEQLKALKISKARLQTLVKKLNFSALSADLNQFKQQLKFHLAQIQADEQKMKRRSKH